jgi:hypothetical protein
MAAIEKIVQLSKRASGFGWALVPYAPASDGLSRTN